MEVVLTYIGVTIVVTIFVLPFLLFGVATDEGGGIKRARKAYREGRDGLEEVAEPVEPEEAWYNKPRVWDPRVWWIAVIVLIAVSGFAGGGSGGTNSATTPSAATTGAWVDPGPVFAPLKGGDLVFTVSAATATKRLTSPLGNKSGNWILVTVTVKNQSKDAVTIDSSFFKLLAADGSTYETDSDNLVYLPADKNFFPAKINPNRTKSGQVLFAVAAGAKPQDFKLQVQARGLRSGTVEIALTK